MFKDLFSSRQSNNQGKTVESRGASRFKPTGAPLRWPGR